MTTKNALTFMMLCFLFHSVSFAEQSAVAPMEQPSVNRRAMICDKWQWIGNGNTTWGCLTLPREVSVAHGQTTDQVIMSLQDQVNKLQDRLKKLEQP